jgi:flagellar hook-length control protein FliK
MQPNLKAAAAAAAPPGSDTGKVSDVSRASADSLVSPQMAGARPAPGSAATDASASATAPGQSGASQSAIAAAGRAVALRLNRAIRNGEETLTVELHPAELGHVAVKLAFHASGVDVQMVLDRQETFQAFTQDRGSLEQQFAQAGIDLGNGGLDLRFGQGGQSGSERGSGMSSSPAATVAAPAESQSILLDGLVNIVA